MSATGQGRRKVGNVIESFAAEGAKVPSLFVFQISVAAFATVRKHSRRDLIPYQLFIFQ
jgi:hypothetical protein